MAAAAALKRLLAAVCLLLVAPWTLAASCLDEGGWHRLQARSKQSPVLLYVWSPRMVLSAIHAHEVQAEAQRLGLTLVAVHDGRLPTSELQQALHVLQQRQPAAYATLAQSRALCTPSLIQADAYRHFPTAWVVRGGGYHSVPLVAAMPPAYWRQGLQLRLAAPEQQWRMLSEQP